MDWSYSKKPHVTKKFLKVSKYEFVQNVKNVFYDGKMYLGIWNTCTEEIKLILVIQVDESRDVLVNRNVALNRASDHLTKVSAKKNKFPLNFAMMMFSLQCYIETLNSMVTLQNQYLESKNEKNIFHRYNRLRSMVKV